MKSKQVLSNLRVQLSSIASYAEGQLHVGPLLVSVQACLASGQGVFAQFGSSIQSASAEAPVPLVIFLSLHAVHERTPAVDGW